MDPCPGITLYSSDVDMHTVYTAFPRILTLSLTTTGCEKPDTSQLTYFRGFGDRVSPCEPTWAARSALTQSSQESCHHQFLSLNYRLHSCRQLSTPDAYWETQKTNGQTVFIRNAATLVTLFLLFALHSLLWLRLVKKLEQSWNYMCSDQRVELTPDSQFFAWKLWQEE